VWNMREIVAGYEILNFVIAIIFIQYYQGVSLIYLIDGFVFISTGLCEHLI